MPGRLKQPIWIVPLAIAALVALLGWWGHTRVRQIIREELKSDLSATLDANVTALEIWTTNQMRMATELADEPGVRSLANRILDNSPPLRGITNGLLELEEFGTTLRPRLARMGYQTAQLVNTNFVVVASSMRGPIWIGQPVSEAHTNKFADLFELGQPVLITPFKPGLLIQRRPRRGGPGPRGNNEFGGSARGAPVNPARGRRGDYTLMQVAAPVREGGIIHGALAIIVNPDHEFTRILSVAHSGMSGETYAFDQTGLLISRSRFDDELQKLGLLEPGSTNSALNLRLHDPGGDLTQGFKPASTNLTSQPLIHLVAEAVSGEEGGVDVEPFRDYRGVPVVGAWRWLPQLGFGVATQVNASDAYHPLRVLQFIFIGLFLLLVLCAIGLLMFSYANITSRQKLTEAELKLKQLGQYTLEEKIGEGGMGVVYRARHALMRRDTAVKLLLPDRANPASIERFEREVCMTCQLAHPNTIQVYDYGHTPEGIFYYAMEFLRGLNLHQLVARYGPVPEGRVVNILTQVCDSLAEAHAMGLVHRDIKPANVFLCDRGGVPDYVKVLDFGLVREYPHDADDKTREHEFVGTPSFMPPEAIKNSATNDPRSDIYAVGALAYFLLTGKYAYDCETVPELYEKQLNSPPVLPTAASDNPISEEMESVIMRCLSADPNLRPQSALELAALFLSSPRAADSTPEARAAWWAEFHRQEIEAAAVAETESASSMPTIHVDIGSRLDQQDSESKS